MSFFKRATKELLLQPAPRPVFDVDVPGLDASVAIRRLTAAERAAAMTASFDIGGMLDFAENNARVLAACLVDPAVSLEEARQIMQNWTGGMVQAIVDAATAESDED